MMAKAYWVATYKSIDDAEKFAAYIKLAGPAIESGGGTFLTRGAAVVAHEHGILERTTIILFESMDAAIATHDGPGYQDALRALDGGCTRDIRFVEGLN